MRKILMVFLCLMVVSLAKEQPPPPRTPPPPGAEPEVRRPDGRSQRNAIAKDDYQKSLEDSRELVKLAESLQAGLEKTDQYVVSGFGISKTEDIEMLAKKIRSRLNG